MPLVGKKAPEGEFSCVVNGKEVRHHMSFADLEGHFILLFFYPLDFTFVCPTELHAFQEKLGEFEKRNCKVLGCSIDSIFSHLAWLKTPKREGGIQGVMYPLISDVTKELAQEFQVLKEDEGIAYRGLFLIDTKGVIRHSLVNDLSLGRSVDEALRTLDALIFSDEHGEVCPANWHKGEKAMKPTEEGVKGFFAS